MDVNRNTTLALLGLMLFFFLLINPIPSQAAGASGSWSPGASGSWSNDSGLPSIANPGEWLQIKIPTAKFTDLQKCPDDPNKICVNWIAEYIAGIYKYAIGIVGILATVVMMIGGVMWMVSGGNASTAGEAKAWITSSLTGLIIALSSYAILYQINPALVNYNILKVDIVRAVPLTESQAQYDKMNCPSDEEMKTGFSVYTTGYCRPERSNFSSEEAFLCAVGLNCSCPGGDKAGQGRDYSKVCPNMSIKVNPCKPFTTTDYCNKTASGASPAPGTIAASSCFPIGSQYCVGTGTDKKTYTVTDRGSAIQGRRFDIWVNCSEAGSVTKNQQVTRGLCE